MSIVLGVMELEAYDTDWFNVILVNGYLELDDLDFEREMVLEFNHCVFSDMVVSSVLNVAILQYRLNLKLFTLVPLILYTFGQMMFAVDCSTYKIFFPCIPLHGSTHRHLIYLINL